LAKQNYIKEIACGFQRHRRPQRLYTHARVMMDDNRRKIVKGRKASVCQIRPNTNPRFAKKINKR